MQAITKVTGRERRKTHLSFLTLRKVLLIDDDPMQLRVREAVLRDAGFEVFIATTGEAGLALLRTNPVASGIGVVITDHMMPGLSGPELVREIREVKPDLPIIVLSGFPDVVDEYEGLTITFRQKPCPPPELIQLAKAAVGSNQAA